VVMKMFHEKMGRIINEHKGYINDIVADNILATWGILDEKGNSADMAIQSAIHQLMEMSEFNRELETHGLPRLEIRIGIHSAELVIGDMGEGHLSAMGDGVNLAIRVCSLAKNLKTNLLITEFAQKQSKRRDFIKVVEFKSISHRRDINLYQLSQHE
jgi:adenylate cyclase